ncbi:MAG TPA: hypothetical protein VNM69_12360 [Bacillus sp. (in: firmicutes)]|uniref:hypothetical protein n=1 Tax=Bacillus litorisediminis TaxID=2922713 RepID=UPI001FAC751C|nr:hypothetical protein [Bacillus litorisediminis]HWO76673.1 hypothetical protein [Bacillus sp. (in: firmicutes)]
MMNEIYADITNQYMKQSLWLMHLSLFVVMICIIWDIPYGIWIISPLFVLSLISGYMSYVYRNRTFDTTSEKRDHSANSVTNDFVILKDGTTVYFMDPTGRKHYTVRNRGKSVFTLYNQRNFPVCSIEKSLFSSSPFTIRNHKHKLIAVYMEGDTASFFAYNGKVILKDESFSIKSIHLHHFCFESESRERIAFVQKGWMPILWQKRFPANAPTITFKEDADIERREILLLVIGYILLQK